MTLDESLAQAVFAKGLNKDGWSQAEPWGKGRGRSTMMNTYVWEEGYT